MWIHSEIGTCHDNNIQCFQQTQNVLHCPPGVLDYEANGEFCQGKWPRIGHDDAGCFMLLEDINYLATKIAP